MQMNNFEGKKINSDSIFRHFQDESIDERSQNDVKEGKWKTKKRMLYANYTQEWLFCDLKFWFLEKHLQENGRGGITSFCRDILLQSQKVS